MYTFKWNTWRYYGTGIGRYQLPVPTQTFVVIQLLHST